MLYSGNKFRAAGDKKKINILTLALSENKFLNETKKHNPPPPLQVKWSIPKTSLVLSHPNNKQKHEGYSRNTCRVPYI